MYHTCIICVGTRLHPFVDDTHMHVNESREHCTWAHTTTIASPLEIRTPHAQKTHSHAKTCTHTHRPVVLGGFTFPEARAPNGANTKDTTNCDNVLVSWGGNAASTHSNAPITAEWSPGAASVVLSQLPEQRAAQLDGLYHYEHDFWKGISSPEPQVLAQSRRGKGDIT